MHDELKPVDVWLPDYQIDEANDDDDCENKIYDKSDCLFSFVPYCTLPNSY